MGPDFLESVRWSPMISKWIWLAGDAKEDSNAVDELARHAAT